MISNEIRESLKEVCETLNKRNVEYLIIGGVAVAFYGYQRLSGAAYPGRPEIKHDIDFWYRPTLGNYHNLVKALKEIGIDTRSLEEIIFDPDKTFLRIPHKTFKTEFLPKMTGLGSFTDSLKNAKEVFLDGNRLLIIGYSDLLKNKEAVGRDIDHRDVEELKYINRRGTK